MAGLNPPSGVQSVLSTPSRDRDRDRHPFPPTAHPSPAPSMRQTTSSSAAASFTSLSSSTTSSSSAVQVSPTPLTVEGLLKLHATAFDPKAAALDQAISERNVLSSQNTQLWKLIEKQRAGYNQILKELERIRGERDSYKTKLSALNALPNGSSSKQQKSSTERTSRPSLDTVTSQASTTSQNRQTYTRHNSDDSSATPRTSQYPHHLHPSRSFDSRSSENGFQSNAAHLTTPIRTASPLPPPPTSAPNPPTRQFRPSPSPLVVPPRGENILLASSTHTNSPDTFAFSKQPPTSDPNTTPNNSAPNGIYPSSVPPLAHPRKASVADSFTSVVTSGSSVVSGSSPATSVSTHSLGANPTTTPSQQTYHTGYTPQTAPSGFNASPLPQDSRQRTPSSAAPLNNSPPTIATPTNSASAPLSLQQIPQPQPNMLSAVVETRSHVLSRDSRISLPDEARQYIVNMADSPVASPRTDHFSPRSKLANSVFPSTANGSTGENGRESEFLDMGEEDDSDEESDAEGAGDVTAGASDPTFDTVRPINTHAAAGQTHHEPSTQSAYQPPHVEHLNNYSSHSNSSREDLDSIQSKRKEKSRVAAEEFPLPPPSNPYVQRQQLQQQGPASMDGRDQPSGPQSSLYAQQSMSAPAPSPSKHTQSTADQYPHSSLSSSGNHQQQHQHPSSHDTYTSMQQQQPESPYSAPPPPPYQLQADGRGHHQQQPSLSHQEFPGPHTTSVVQAGAFRALPLLSTDLPHTNIIVSHSFVRPNDRGKEVLSFIVYVNPGNGKDGWKVEKMYSDVLSLDQRVRSSVGKGVGKKIANLPEGKLWKDHAPAKVDQRKAVLENYLQTLIHLPVKNNDEVIAFFTTDIVREQKQPVMQVGHKEGYLTKRGKNFGGWKTRFFVLQGPVLEYYDCRGGAHLGSISITGAQIARQHRTEKPPTTDDEKEYRHAFLIVEAKKGPGGNHPRHVLCAESDEDRDSWVEMLVRYYTGTYSEDLVFNPSSGLTSLQSNSVAATSQQPSLVSVNSVNLGQPRSSTSSNDISTPLPAPMAAPSTPRSKPPTRGLLREEISRGPAVPISQLPPDGNNAKLFQTVPTSEDYSRSASPSRSVEPSPIDRQGPSAANYGFEPQKRTMERSALGLPSSLPDSSSPLSGAQPFQPDAASSVVGGQRANSELGHYPDLQPNRGPPVQPQRQQSPEHHRIRERDDGRRAFQPSLNTVASSPTTATGASATGTPPPDRVPSPEKLDASGKVKISGPMNGAPIPSGFKFGGKDAPSADSSSASANNDRREKAKSRSFWGFGKGDKGQPHATFTPRAVFGVPLEEALEVAQVCNLPAIVFRSIQYLQAKKADQEEGIYRLSGSSAVIKSLKDRFNNEGDVDLLASDEYWDPHAIAGLLKSFLRELPSSILTRDLHLKFLAVIDFVDPQERIKELSQLIAALPLANYSLLRALTAHLILIVQNSNVNKMTMRNVGIVFSPTLGIPAGVFSLMLGEFNRVFDVDADTDEPRAKEGGGLLEHPSEALRRNSRQYTDAAADQVLGLSGRTLSTSAEETQSDGDDFSIQDESGTETTEGDATVESSSSSPASAMMQRDHGIQINTPDSTPNTPTAKTTSRAANVAASRGLNVAVTTSERGNRHSRMMGLPLSPRLHAQSHSPSRGEPPSNTSPTHARSE